MSTLLEVTMCDYSLEVYGSQPAREGERYVTSRFPSGTIGLTAPDKLGTAVCLACDTPLMIDNIPPELRSTYKLGDKEKAVFIRLDSGSYQDGVRFENGAEVCLQRFQPGSGFKVGALLEHAKPVSTRKRMNELLDI
jgi:hypothetical protein